MDRRHTLLAATARTRISAGTLATLGILLFGLVLRLYRLDAQSLWLDEGGTWSEVTRQSWQFLLADLFRPTAAYPLYHLLVKGWVTLAGDSEWALRLPSALAGAGMVAIIALAARQMGQKPLVAALLAACSPYALWHAQDAKAYSLLMLVVALLLWLGLRTHSSSSPKPQAPSLKLLVILGTLIIISLFVHRLALLPVAGLLLALAIIGGRSHQTRFALIAGVGATGAGVLGVAGLARSVAANGWQESGHSAASPWQSIWLNLQHFILDRGDIGGFAGVPLVVWMLPGLLLTIWGLALLMRDAWRGDAAATIVASMFVTPLLLFAVALAFTPVYEARYAAVAFPAWVLVVATAATRLSHAGTRGTQRRVSIPTLAYGLTATMLATNAAVLFQPQHGQFSGAPVKEQWREAIGSLARELHPDDLLILHPYYTMPLWDYYAPRVTPDPLPVPVTFAAFGQGLCVEDNQGNAAAIRECYRRTYEDPFRTRADGKKRALVLLAPDHAATIDPPKTLEDLQADYEADIIDKLPDKADKYGWVGLRFVYPQKTWTCGRNQEFVGVEWICQSFPETFRADISQPSAPPAPAVPLEATFGGEIMLRGYSINLFGGKARPGGRLPITLYWQSIGNPSKNYSMFLHLCQNCEQPPLAGVDEPPLHGYPPAGRTSTWQGYPVHDARSLALPPDLAPGRYTLVLGVRPADEDPLDQSLRLPITNTQGQTIGSTRLILGEINIGP